MFILLPIRLLTPILAIYIGAAVLPAVVLLHYVHRHDTVEKEPPLLLASLLGWGAVSAVCSGVLESVGMGTLGLFFPRGGRLYTILLAFLVVAAVEEGAKFFFLYRATWRHPAFNYRFDGVVYAVFVSLGFAALENIRYVFAYGLAVAVPRALLAVPGHMAFSVFMGVPYGQAKLYESWGDGARCQVNLWRGYLAAAFLHGLYDACALTGTLASSVVFLIVVAGMFTAAFRSLKRWSENDVRVT